MSLTRAHGGADTPPPHIPSVPLVNELLVRILQARHRTLQHRQLRLVLGEGLPRRRSDSAAQKQLTAGSISTFTIGLMCPCDAFVVRRKASRLAPVYQ